MRNGRRWNIGETAYPAVRRVMGRERYLLDDAELEDRLEKLFPNAEPDDVENFMRTVQGFGNQVAPLAQRALPGAIQGAATGATVAGPWGAVAGLIGGGAASALGGGARRPGAPAPGPTAPAVAPVLAPSLAPSMTPAVAPAVTPLQAAPGMTAEPSAVGASMSAAQLLALLSRPETLQALLAMLMADAGRSTVPVGTQAVPAAAFANAVAEIAAEVTERAAPSHRSRISDYLTDDDGTPRCDLANPRSRAALLLGDIASVAAAEADDAGEDAGGSGAEYDEEDEEIETPLDSYEAALLGRERY